MRRSLLAAVLVLAALAAPAGSGQPVATDSIAHRPAFSVPVTGDFAPPQTSAVRAYLYSAAATAVPVAAGVLLLQAGGPSDTPGQATPGDLGIVLVIAGAAFGPAVGNLSLGAGTDVRRGVALVAGGFAGGVVLAGGGVAIAGFCIAGDLASGQLGSADCAAEPLAVALLVAGVAVAAVGAVAGTAYSLATVPRNASRARTYRRAHPRVAVAPGWRAGAPALGIRVGL